ncbi:MAG: mechanosensitive ion channel family protein [Sneathiella sp.]|nr:mechanosensitive ion channel family protein [Sneathiella sp.]
MFDTALSHSIKAFFRRKLTVIAVLFPVLVVGMLVQPAGINAAEIPIASNIAPAQLLLHNQSQPGDPKDYLLDNPISPPDTSSPRATMESFIFLMREARQIWLEVRNEFAQSSASFLSADQERRLDQLRTLLDKASQTFDLSGIPASTREHVSMEIALQLHEIFDRIDLPAFKDVPGHEAGSLPKSDVIARLPENWALPGTNIVIAREESGPNKGHYLFSKETVERIPADYETIKSFPLKFDQTEDLFDYYIYTPGGLVAPRWYELITAGPDWLRDKFYNQASWQWMMFLFLTFLAVALPAGYLRWNRWRAVSLSPAQCQLRHIFLSTVVILLALAYRHLCNDQINITGGLMQGIGTVTTAIIWTSAALLTYQMMNFIYFWAMKNPAVPTDSIDASLLRTGFRVFAFAVALLILGYGATQIGIPVYGVIAGLGVGGLAIALAAQPTIENLIGGVILYADRMVRIGEYCKFDDLAGTVESIGIRSTRIRALNRTVITVANADLAKRKITNFSRRDKFHLHHRFGLRFDTTEEQLSGILGRIRTYLETHESILENPLRVRFVELGDYSLTVEIYAYVAVADMAEFLAIQEEILMKIVEIVHAQGADFAFPSTTTYLASDKDSATLADPFSWRPAANIQTWPK